jgi:hypothetical protein
VDRCAGCGRDATAGHVEVVLRILADPRPHKRDRTLAARLPVCTRCAIRVERVIVPIFGRAALERPRD